MSRTAKPIGSIQHIPGRGHQAACTAPECDWKITNRDRDDALSRLRSHHRIAHLNTPEPVYLED